MVLTGRLEFAIWEGKLDCSSFVRSFVMTLIFLFFVKSNKSLLIRARVNGSSF